MSYPNWKGGSGTAQTLSYDPATDTLSISNGNSVVIAPDVVSAANIEILDGATATVVKGTIGAPGAGADVIFTTADGSSILTMNSGDQSVVVGGTVVDTYLTNKPAGSERFLRTAYNVNQNITISDVCGGTYRQEIEFAPAALVVHDTLTTQTIGQNPSVSQTPLDIEFKDGTGALASMQLNQTTKALELKTYGSPVPGGQFTGVSVASNGNTTLYGSLTTGGPIDTPSTSLPSYIRGPLVVNAQPNAFLRAVPAVNDVVSFTTPVSATHSPYVDIVIPNIPDTAGMIRVDWDFQCTTGYAADYFSPFFATWQCGDSVAPARGTKYTVVMNQQRIQGADNQNWHYCGSWYFVRNLDWVGDSCTIAVVDAYFAGGGLNFNYIIDVASVF